MFSAQSLVDNTNQCRQFFHGTLWPIPITFKNSKNLVKLSQNQIGNKPVFATLFDTERKFAIYSANRLLLNDNYILPRAHDDYLLWRRMCLGLCRELSDKPVMSNIETVEKATFQKCKKYQASNQDYINNNLDLSRGHLEPRNTNNNEIIKQNTTYTLTNAAPQYKNFNNGSWKKIEYLTKNLIQKLAPNLPVYVVTGTEGLHKIMLKNRVRVPAFYWKAVCFPGNSDLKKWGYATVYLKK